MRFVAWVCFNDAGAQPLGGREVAVDYAGQGKDFKKVMMRDLMTAYGRAQR
jgi:hypothetical protein